MPSFCSEPQVAVASQGASEGWGSRERADREVRWDRGRSWGTPARAMVGLGGDLNEVCPCTCCIQV